MTDPHDALRVRRAGPDDARSIARVHVDAWRVAYADLMPAAHLDGLSVERRARGWRVNLSAPDSEYETWVCEDGEVAGFLSLQREPELLEVAALYVAPERWGERVGTTLWDAKVRGACGGVWVLEDNEPARRFYEARGCVLDEGRVDWFEVAGARLREVRYVFASP